LQSPYSSQEKGSSLSIPRSAFCSFGGRRLHLWFQLVETASRTEIELRDRLRKQFSLTLPQFEAMAILASAETGMTMTELSRGLMVSSGNVTGIVSRLTSEKCVQRRSSSEDRRTINVRLTNKGRTRFNVAAEAYEKWVDGLFNGLTSEKVDALAAEFAELRTWIGTQNT
jgi:DNA-binding MarR family transcriptional regulator